MITKVKIGNSRYQKLNAEFYLKLALSVTNPAACRFHSERKRPQTIGTACSKVKQLAKKILTKKTPWPMLTRQQKKPRKNEI